MFKPDKLIPKEGLTIGGITFQDRLDVDESVLKPFYESLKADVDLIPLTQSRIEIMERGLKDLEKSKTIKGFEVCGFFNNDIIGATQYKEWPNNPDGYGVGDFDVTSAISKQFRFKPITKKFQGCLKHILFRSGIAKRLYGYVPVFEEGDHELDIWNRSQKTPCVTSFQSRDIWGIEYIKIIKLIKMNVCDVILYEMDGKLYNSINFEGFFNVHESLKELEDIAKTVKETYEISNNSCIVEPDPSVQP